MSDHETWNDRECMEALMNLRHERITRGIPRTRFVARLNRAGFEITASEYAAIEDAPLRGVDHVRKGLIDYGTKAFDPLPEIYQNAPVRHMTETLSQARMDQGLSFDQMAEAISEMGYPITRDQYRAIEQGMTRRVPIEVIIYAGMRLQVPGPKIFPQFEW